MTHHELPCLRMENKAAKCAGISDESYVTACGNAAMTEDTYHIYISGEGFSYTFSKHYGTFTSMVVDGEEQLVGKSVLSAFRVPTDNDRNIINKWAKINIWEGENLYCAFSKVYNCHVEDGVIRL